MTCAYPIYMVYIIYIFMDSSDTELKGLGHDLSLKLKKLFFDSYCLEWLLGVHLMLCQNLKVKY